MNAETIDKILDFKKPEILEVDKRRYSTVHLTPLRLPVPGCLEVNTLTSIVDYIKDEIDDLGNDFKYIIHIERYNQVSLFSPLDDEFYDRAYFLTAKANLPDIRILNNFSNQENFIINLLSSFKQTDDRDYLFSVAGNITKEGSIQIEDDGVSQKTQVKQGIKTKENIIKKVVTLQPFRTFLEAEQPASEFIFRLNDNFAIGLYEADGGAWKLQAMQNIKTYLEDQLKDIENVFILA